MRVGPRLLLEWEPRWRGFITSIGPALSRAPRPTKSRLVVLWEPRWRGFRTSLRPALARSARPLEGECPAGLFSRHGNGLSLAAHAALIVGLAFVASPRMHAPDAASQTIAKYEVIYYSGDFLPQTEDSGGAQAGREGANGGSEAYARNQLMHIVRGDRLVEAVAEAPALRLPKTDTAANLLAFTPPEPMPAAVDPPRSLSNLPVPALNVVPPPPTAERTRMAMAPQPGVAVVEPAPAAPERRLAAVPVTNADVVPPPVSVPARDTDTNARLELPATQVVGPPPADFARALRARTGTGTSISGNDVVPPPPTPGGRQIAAQPRTGFGDVAGVIPPSPALNKGNLDKRGETSRLFGNATVAPPPQGPSAEDVRHAAIGAKSRATGLGNSGVVISLAPGARVGMPTHGGEGSLAMSPSGNGKNGLGGSGRGAGTGVGSGSGNGARGAGPGATVAGNGHGDNPAARGGTSPSAGPGGSGLGGSNRGEVAGVTIRGGIVTLPDFGAPGGSAPNLPAGNVTPNGPRTAPDITIVATSRSGGALATYGMLHGSKVYTIYLDTQRGPAVLEYAARSEGREFETELTAPEAVNTNLPATLAKASFVVACVIDRSGLLKNFRVLENAGVQSAAVLSAIHDWRFRPVLRGDEAVEVDAIVGFGVGTR